MAELKFCVTHEVRAHPRPIEIKMYFVLPFEEQLLLSHIFRLQSLPNARDEIALECHDHHQVIVCTVWEQKSLWSKHILRQCRQFMGMTIYDNHILGNKWLRP